MRKIIKFCIATISCGAFLFGIGIMIYPTVVDTVYTNQVIANKEEMQKAEVTSALNNNHNNLNELYQAMLEYNNSLTKNQVLSTNEYNAFSVYKYGINNGIIGYIEIPRLDVTMPIRIGSSDDVLNQGAGLMIGTSLPIMSHNTNTVIVAHRGWDGRQLLRHIERLQNGDLIYIDNIFGEHIVFRVTKYTIIPKGSTDGLYIEQDKDLLTLYTCHPYRVNTHRYIVTCERSDNG